MKLESTAAVESADRAVVLSLARFDSSPIVLEGTALAVWKAIDGGSDTTVWGRGWPDLAGWKVHEGFVSEERLDELIRTAGAVLIPYRRFYQSGIAMRALECRVPFVGPRDSSLADLYEPSSPLLVAAEYANDGSAWWEAVRAARALSSADLERAAREASVRTAHAWRKWLIEPDAIDERGSQ